MKGTKILDGSTIWEDGSRTYGASGKAADPPKTWPYPPASGGIPVEIATETPAQHPGIAVGEPYGPEPRPSPGPVVSTPKPTIEPQHEIAPLPVGAPSTEVWDRWQKLVEAWACLIAWGGGSLDTLTKAIGVMPLYTTNKGAKTAIGWWRGVQDGGYDKAASLADLGKGLGIDMNDVAVLVGQLNDLAVLARAKGYRGCPMPAPPPGSPSPAEDTLATISNARAGISRAWSGLSPRGKLVAGGVGIAGLILIVRGVAK
jgi:hypothetical protein